jgi:preprotein translocase subunit SecY
MQRRLWLTVLALGLYRIGRHVPVPGLDTEPLGFLFYRSSLRNYEMFASVSRLMSVCSQGIMPYISASIVILILSRFIPRLRALRQGDRPDQLTFDRIILGMTIIICFTQGFFMAMGLEGLTRMGGESLVLHSGWGFRLLTAVTMTTGTMILVWLAYQVTRRGLGNGVLIFLMAGLLEKAGLGLVTTMQTIRQRGFLLAQEHTLLEIILRVAIPVAIFLVAVRIVLPGTGFVLKEPKNRIMGIRPAMGSPFHYAST